MNDDKIDDKVEGSAAPDATTDEQTEPEPAGPRERLKDQCIEEFYSPGGAGGQHKNRTLSGVRLRHRPTGIVVTATERRSRHQNLEMAYDRLQKRINERNKPRKKRVPTKASKGEKRRRLKEKKIRAGHKKNRAKPGEDE